MTVGDILTLVDALEPNQYSAQQKKSWLTQLDGRIFCELLQGREGFGRVRCPVYTSLRQPLLVPPPYAEGIYVSYLQAMIALENAETVRYSQQMQLFNASYREYSNYVNRIMSPRNVTTNRIRF